MNFLYSAWGMRVLAPACLALEIWIIWGESWFVRVAGVIGIVIICLTWYGQEIRLRHRKSDLWAEAASTGDPMAYLAAHDYFAGLRWRDQLQIVRWVSEHPWEFTTQEDLDDAPPVVRGFVAAMTNPPREP